MEKQLPKSGAPWVDANGRLTKTAAAFLDAMRRFFADKMDDTTTPTITSFVSAGHNHQNAVGGTKLDHGAALTGLGDDDHTQYHNDARGDARYDTRYDARYLALANVSSGTFTLDAAASKTINDVKVTANSRIICFPTNASAAAIMLGTKSLYISAKTAGASFAVSTQDGTNAAGTETFDYILLN